MSEAIAALVGVALGAAFTLVRDWMNGRRADRTREANTAAERVRFERDIVGELLVGLQLWVTSVANRKWAFDQLRKGNIDNSRFVIDAERFRKYHADAETFAAALSRARVSIQNPAARTHLADLRVWHQRMALMLSIMAEGSEIKEFAMVYEEYEKAMAAANRGLEEAALQWDGQVAALTTT